MNNLTYLVRTLILSVCILVFGSQSAGAWTWVLHHDGQAPAPIGPTINGGGKLIQRQNYSPGSNSQRWSFVENGNGRHMIVNLASKKCLNAYQPQPGSRPNDFLCSRDDKEQQFRVRKLKDVPHSEPAMDVMLQVADIYHNGQGLCLNDANGVFKLDICNQANQGMVFRMDRVSTFIATEIVNQGTEASRNSSSGGSRTLRRVVINNSRKVKGPSLIRTGGSYGGVAWKDHEHPFKVIQAGLDQNQGNRQCLIEYQNMPVSTGYTRKIGLDYPSANNSFEVNIGGINYTFDQDLSKSGNEEYEFVVRVIRALDGENIYEQWHIWYHKSAGICVANR